MKKISYYIANVIRLWSWFCSSHEGHWCTNEEARDWPVTRRCFPRYHKVYRRFLALLAGGLASRNKMWVSADKKRQRAIVCGLSLDMAGDPQALIGGSPHEEPLPLQAARMDMANKPKANQTTYLLQCMDFQTLFQ